MEIKKISKGLLDAVMQVTAKSPIVEETQIDELSNKTLSSYATKALKDGPDQIRKSKAFSDISRETAAQGDKENAKEYGKLGADAASKGANRMAGAKLAIKKMAKEEVEELDEISKKTIGSYIEKANHSANRAHTKMAVSDSSKVGGNWDKAFDTKEKRIKGIKLAVKKLTKEDLDSVVLYDEDLGIGTVLEATDTHVEIMFDESVQKIALADIFLEEVEQIDELSRETLRSYTDKAKSDPAFEKKRGKPSKATVAIRAKRTKGLDTAKEKLTAIAKAEYEARHKQIDGFKDNLANHFEEEAPKILAKHGYTKTAEGIHGEEGYQKHVTSFVKGHDNGHVSVISIHKDLRPSTLGYSKHEVRSVSSKGTSWSTHQAHRAIWGQEDHDKYMTDMMPNFESHVINVKNDTSNHGNW